MRNSKNKSPKAKPEVDELPDELDPKKLRFIGFGLDALRAHAAKKRKKVELEPDVAKVFPDSESVNQALRSVIDLLALSSKKHRKSA